ncbi:TPA: ribosomal protein L23a-like [Bos taurus]|nr:TPA: ribosomal protein L23a-like [Bos taurus]
MRSYGTGVSRCHSRAQACNAHLKLSGKNYKETNNVDNASLETNAKRNRKDYKRILWLFMKTAPKAGKEVPAPTQTEAKAKRLKTKKAVLKGIHSHRKKIRKSPTFQQPKTLWLRRQSKYAQKSTPRRNKLDYYATIKFPLTTESARKKIEDNTLVSSVDVKADKPHIRPAVKKFYDTNTAKVNTLIGPDGEKKTSDQLAPDYDTLAIANTVGLDLSIMKASNLSALVTVVRQHVCWCLVQSSFMYMLIHN